VRQRGELRENIGSAIGVSGTIGAALEADVYNIPAIAAAITAEISEWRTFGEMDWTAATHFTRVLAAQVLEDGMPSGVSVLNLNVPRGATTQTELRKTVQGHQPYYVRSKPTSTRPLHLPLQFPLEIVVDSANLEPGTDIHAVVHDRVASVTPLTWRMTADTPWIPRLPADERDTAAGREAPWT
jgi:5'-nucleotidase